jgi:hypothetical protein
MDGEARLAFYLVAGCFEVNRDLNNAMHSCSDVSRLALTSGARSAEARWMNSFQPRNAFPEPQCQDVSSRPKPAVKNLRVGGLSSFGWFGQGGGDEGFHRFFLSVFAPERNYGTRRQCGAKF